MADSKNLNDMQERKISKMLSLWSFKFKALHPFFPPVVEAVFYYVAQATLQLLPQP